MPTLPVFSFVRAADTALFHFYLLLFTSQKSACADAVKSEKVKSEKVKSAELTLCRFLAGVAGLEPAE